MIIRDQYPTCSIHRDAIREDELATASRPPLGQECSLGRERLHSSVAELGDEDPALAIHRNAERTVKLAVIRSLARRLGKQGPVHGEHFHSVVSALCCRAR